MRTCKKCRKTFTLNQFAKYKVNSSKKHFRHICKFCWTKQQKEYNDMHGRAAYIKRMYGIKIETYDTILREQNDCCAICYSFFGNTKPCIDHDHNTGKVRGLLCNSCNKMLGFSKDDVNILESAVEYLESK